MTEEQKNKVEELKKNKEYEKKYNYVKELADTGDKDAMQQYAICYLLGEGVEKDEENGFEMLLELAEDWHVPSVNSVGWCYEFGKGVEKDEVKAVEYYKLAAGQGYARAQFNLGVCYSSGRGVEKDEAKAVEYYKLAADQGYETAQFALGECYRKGLGIEENDIESFKHYKLAADQGHIKSQYYVGLWYAQGYGVKKNKKESQKYLQLAADAGYYGEIVTPDDVRPYYEMKKAERFRNMEKSGETILGPSKTITYDDFLSFLGANFLNDDYDYNTIIDELMISGDKTFALKTIADGMFKKGKYDTALQIYLNISSEEDSEIQYRIGNIYENNIESKDNMVTAYKHYKLSADNGNAMAQFRIGLCLKNGEGVQQNDKEAINYFKKASKQGIELAKTFLADLLVDTNREEAITYYKSAVEAGETTAMLSLGALYMDESETNDNLQCAIELFTKAVNMEDTTAMVILGICYLNGKGVQKNPQRAVELFKKAVNMEDTTAMVNLGICYLTGEGVQKNPQRAFELFENAAEKGSSEAQVLIGVAYLFGFNVEQNEETAYDYIYHSSKNSQIGKFILSIFYEKGIIVDKSDRKSIDLRNEVYNTFDEETNNQLENIYQELCSYYSITIIDKNENPYLEALYFSIADLFGAGGEDLHGILTTLVHERTLKEVDRQKIINMLPSIKEFTYVAKEWIKSITSIVSSNKRKFMNSDFSLLSEHDIEIKTDEFVNKTAKEIANVNYSDEKNTNSINSQLVLYFGQGWAKLQEYTKKSLLSAKTFLQITNNNTYYSLDFSGIIISATSALENELKKLLFDDYKKYLAERFDDIRNWPSSMTYCKRNGDIIPSNVFTLGSIPYIFGVASNSSLSQNDKDILNTYLGTVLNIPAGLTGIEYFSQPQDGADYSFVEKCESIRMEYRNPAAHTETVERELAKDCCDKIIGIDEAGEKISKIEGLLLTLSILLK